MNSDWDNVDDVREMTHGSLSISMKSICLNTSGVPLDVFRWDPVRSIHTGVLCCQQFNTLTTCAK